MENKKKTFWWVVLTIFIVIMIEGCYCVYTVKNLKPASVTLTSDDPYFAHHSTTFHYHYH